MKLSLYSLRDTKSGTWLQPICHRHDIEAQRALVALIATTDCGISRYPGDYDLFRVAEFDDETGVVSPVPPLALMSATTAANLARSEYRSYMGQPIAAFSGESPSAA